MKDSGDGRGVSDKELWKNVAAFWGLMYLSVVFRHGSATSQTGIGSEERLRVDAIEQSASLSRWRNSEWVILLSVVSAMKYRLSRISSVRCPYADINKGKPS